MWLCMAGKINIGGASDKHDFNIQDNVHGYAVLNGLFLLFCHRQFLINLPHKTLPFLWKSLIVLSQFVWPILRIRLRVLLSAAGQHKPSKINHSRPFKALLRDLSRGGSVQLSNRK